MTLSFVFQAFQIANLIREYCEVLAGPKQQEEAQRQQKAVGNRKRTTSGTSANGSRPVSILHKSVPIIDPQPG